MISSTTALRLPSTFLETLQLVNPNVFGVEGKSRWRKMGERVKRSQRSNKAYKDTRSVCSGKKSKGVVVQTIKIGSKRSTIDTSDEHTVASTLSRASTSSRHDFQKVVITFKKHVCSPIKESFDLNKQNLFNEFDAEISPTRGDQATSTALTTLAVRQDQFVLQVKQSTLMKRNEFRSLPGIYSKDQIDSAFTSPISAYSSGSRATTSSEASTSREKAGSGNYFTNLLLATVIALLYLLLDKPPAPAPFIPYPAEYKSRGALPEVRMVGPRSQLLLGYDEIPSKLLCKRKASIKSCMTMASRTAITADADYSLNLHPIRDLSLTELLCARRAVPSVIEGTEGIGEDDEAVLSQLEML